LRELESALRAEKELRRQASDEHFAAQAGLRQRLAEVEAELQQARQALAATEARAAAAEARVAAAEARVAAAAPVVAEAPAARAVKQVQGLRRIRGIGPAYQRVLEQAGVTRVQQVAGWTAADLATFASKLKIRPERIHKDDWIGQARALEPDPED